MAEVVSGVNIKGLAELDKVLRDLPGKLARNVVRGSLRAAATVVADEARVRAPVRTGGLRESIRVSTRVVHGVPQAKVVAGTKSGKKTKGGHDVFYAHMIEGGTAAHTIEPKNRRALKLGGFFEDEQFVASAEHPGFPARPFMRPAMDAKFRQAVLAARDYAYARLERRGIDLPDPGNDEEEA